jgi:hypothetical protein
MSRALSNLVAVSVLFASLVFPGFTRAEQLGQANFANSCSSTAQEDFEQGILLLHSFEYPQAEENFRKVEAADPHCVIAAWGLAFAETERQGANAPKAVLEKGWKEFQPWLNRPAGSVREQMYLDAVKAMYEGYQDTSGTVRSNRYLAAMDSVRRKYPDDINASLFYALGLVWTAGTGQPGLVQRRKALAILLPIFKKHPNNPGAAHYIIHAADTPELAHIALPAAREYAAIAPDSPHAQHMPSHIFNRLGCWNDSIKANLASARVAHEWMKSGRGGLFDLQHALNNLEYAYLELGKTKEAQEIIAQIDQASDARGNDPWGPIDARIYFDVETNAWSDAVAIDSPPKSPFDENFDVYWIHAIAEARLGNTAAARVALEEFRKSSADWTSVHGWDDVFHLALMEAEAWTLFSEGKGQDAVRELSDAVAFEKNHPIYYADVLPRPASEMLGEMLLQMRKNKESCAAFRASLVLAPNTLNSINGLRACANSQITHREHDLSPRPPANPALRVVPLDLLRTLNLRPTQNLCSSARRPPATSFCSPQPSESSLHQQSPLPKVPPLPPPQPKKTPHLRAPHQTLRVPTHPAHGWIPVSPRKNARISSSSGSLSTRKSPSCMATAWLALRNGQCRSPIWPTAAAVMLRASSASAFPASLCPTPPTESAIAAPTVDTPRRCPQASGPHRAGTRNPLAHTAQ